MTCSCLSVSVMQKKNQKSMQGQTIKTDSPVVGSTDTIDTVRHLTKETGMHEYDPNVSNSVLHTVRGLPLEGWCG